MFSKVDTLELGAILTFERWNDTVNINYSFLDEYSIYHTFDAILFECRAMRRRK